MIGISIKHRYRYWNSIIILIASADNVLADENNYSAYFTL